MKTLITSSVKSQIDFGELKRYAGLFRYLSLRDVFVRYKQTWIGIGWSVIRPLINILIFGAISYFIDKSQDFTDRFLKVSAGIVFWQLLSTSLTEVSNSLSANANILTKVYFPKLILPLSSLLVCIVDFLIAFVLLLIISISLKGLPPWQMLFLPLVLINGMVFSFGLGLLFATAAIKYRDVKFILPFIIQVLFYVSPVFLSSDFILNLDIPESIKTLYQINPLVFILNSFKYCMYGTFDSFNAFYALGSVFVSIAVLILSIKYFLKFEKSFTDYI